MTDKEKENRVNSLALNFLQRQQLQPNPFADQILQAYKEAYYQAEKDNSFPKEQVSKDLDIAIGEYCSNPNNFVTYIDVAFGCKTEQKDDIPLIIKAIEFGAKWREEHPKEKPVSEDLEEATNNYCVNARKGYPRVKDETDRYICSAFKAGSQWQKEQIMKNAVECEYFDGSLFRNDLREKYRDGDKVKTVIVKSE